MLARGGGSRTTSTHMGFALFDACRANHKLSLEDIELPENHPWATKAPVSTVFALMQCTGTRPVKCRCNRGLLLGMSFLQLVEHPRLCCG